MSCKGVMKKEVSSCVERSQRCVWIERQKYEIFDFKSKLNLEQEPHPSYVKNGKSSRMWMEVKELSKKLKHS